MRRNEEARPPLLYDQHGDAVRDRRGALLLDARDSGAMIEVIPNQNGFTWRMISAAGRVLVIAIETFPCTFSAAAAAKAYRSTFWSSADETDHRMGACW